MQHHDRKDSEKIEKKSLDTYSTQNLKKSIEKNSLFTCLDSEQIDNFLNNFEMKTYNKNDIIFRQGELDCVFYVIEDGELELYDDPKGHAYRDEGKLMHVLSEGSNFGESGLIFHSKRPYTAIVRSDKLQIWCLNSDSFFKALDSKGNIYSYH
jgi:CRP-like cAMP-binding protein